MERRMKKTTLATAAALSVLALPVAIADARPGHGGRDGGDQQQGGRQQGTAADQYTEGRRPNRRCKRVQSVGFVARGSLAGFTPETITLDVKRANRHARRLIEAAGSTFTLGTARVRYVGVTDGDASGTVDFADVLPTDKVVVIGKAVRPKRGCEGDTVLKLRKVQVIRPTADPEDGEAAPRR
jgi:hypothetical protein